VFTDVNPSLHPASAIPDECPGEICGEADHQYTSEFVGRVGSAAWWGAGAKPPGKLGGWRM